LLARHDGRGASKKSAAFGGKIVPFLYPILRRSAHTIPLGVGPNNTFYNIWRMY
jgi:hypothetical protein